MDFLAERGEEEEDGEEWVRDLLEAVVQSIEAGVKVKKLGLEGGVGELGLGGKAGSHQDQAVIMGTWKLLDFAVAQAENVGTTLQATFDRQRQIAGRILNGFYLRQGMRSCRNILRVWHEKYLIHTLRGGVWAGAVLDALELDQEINLAVWRKAAKDAAKRKRMGMYRSTDAHELVSGIYNLDWANGPEKTYLELMQNRKISCDPERALWGQIAETAEASRQDVETLTEACRILWGHLQAADRQFDELRLEAAGFTTQALREAQHKFDQALRMTAMREVAHVFVRQLKGLLGACFHTFVLNVRLAVHRGEVMSHEERMVEALKQGSEGNRMLNLCQGVAVSVFRETLGRIKHGLLGGCYQIWRYHAFAAALALQKLLGKQEGSKQGMKKGMKQGKKQGHGEAQETGKKQIKEFARARFVAAYNRIVFAVVSTVVKDWHLSMLASRREEDMERMEDKLLDVHDRYRNVNDSLEEKMKNKCKGAAIKLLKQSFSAVLAAEDAAEASEPTPGLCLARLRENMKRAKGDDATAALEGFSDKAHRESEAARHASEVRKHELAQAQARAKEAKTGVEKALASGDTGTVQRLHDEAEAAESIVREAEEVREVDTHVDTDVEAQLEETAEPSEIVMETVEPYDADADGGGGGAGVDWLLEEDEAGDGEDWEAQIEAQILEAGDIGHGTCLRNATEINVEYQLGNDDCWYTVMGAAGGSGDVRMREGAALDSEPMRALKNGMRIRVVGMQEIAGMKLRVHIADTEPASHPKPADGWVSSQFVACDSKRCGHCHHCEHGILPSEAERKKQWAILLVYAERVFAVLCSYQEEGNGEWFNKETLVMAHQGDFKLYEKIDHEGAGQVDMHMFHDYLEMVHRDKGKKGDQFIRATLHTLRHNLKLHGKKPAAKSTVEV